MKKLASPILAALLLSSLAPLPSAVPLAPTAAHAAAQTDTIREYTREARSVVWLQTAPAIFWHAGIHHRNRSSSHGVCRINFTVADVTAPQY